AIARTAQARKRRRRGMKKRVHPTPSVAIRFCAAARKRADFPVGHGRSARKLQVARAFRSVPPMEERIVPHFTGGAPVPLANASATEPPTQGHLHERIVSWRGESRW